MSLSVLLRVKVNAFLALFAACVGAEKPSPHHWLGGEIVGNDL